MPLQLTIVELAGFASRVTGLMTADQYAGLIDYLSMNPKAGDIIRGTGGIRKLRWQSSGTGKRGGNRVIYFFHNMDMPLYLLALYPESGKDNLSAAEQKEFRQITLKIVAQHSKKRRSK